MRDLLPYITIACIVGGGVISGLLFAFSNFVIRALAQMPPEQGMSAMQKINVTIINPLFATLFFGTPVFCALIAVNSIMDLGAPGSPWLLGGALAYLVGPFLITMTFNVPLNNKLARAETSSADYVWPEYQAAWQRWNHIRTYLGILSVLLLSAGLFQLSP